MHSVGWREKAFAAGARHQGNAAESFIDMFSSDFHRDWRRPGQMTTKPPSHQPVSGYALGGGCELAMM